MRRRSLRFILFLSLSLSVSLSISGCRRKPTPNPNKVTGPGTPTDPCPGVVYPPQETSLYTLPWPKGETHNIRQGNCNDLNSHNEKTGAQFAYDMEMPIGTTLIAARAGTVLFAEGRFTDDQHRIDQGNQVVVDHGDRTFALYGHLTQNGPLVKKGDVVAAGQPIGKSGNSGLSKGPHMHFSIGYCPGRARMGSGDCYTTPTTFKNTRPHPRGLIGSPTSEIGAGESYTAE